MTKTTDLPTKATLMRFSINPEKLSEGFEIWTLDFPFGNAVWQYKTKVEQRINEKRNIPYRQLNNTLMTVCPTLTHGFEYTGKGSPYRALAIGVPSNPAQLPDPENIRLIIREWAQLWTESSEIVNKIPEDERITMRAKLLAAINETVDDWIWKRRPANQLLKSFNPNESLNYTALPSLMAAILHGKTSTIHGKQIQWRKVQDKDGSNSKLAIVGFINQCPIHAYYAIQEFQMSDSGEGFGAYKLEFNLETQSGRNAPWMFVSLHFQRYGHNPLTHPNDRRRVSVLTAANRARLDDFPVDSTLIKLQSRDVNDIPEWDDYLVKLLERIGASKLDAPANIFANPQNHWRPPGAGADYSKDEYYIVHAEGYRYGENEAGHELKPGISMTDSGVIFENILNEYLTMLEKDAPLETDKRPFSDVKVPRAMRDYQFMSKTKSLQPDEVEKMIGRALRGQEMQIAILWHDEDTRDGIYIALRKALLLKPEESFPANITITDRLVETALLEAIDSKNFSLSFQQRIRDWRAFLQSQIPKHPNCLAIVEMKEKIGKKDHSWKVKDVVRTACVQENITSQMVRPIRLKLNKSGQQVYLGGKRNHEHRANSAAREIVLRHIGGIYGDPQEIYKAANIKEQNLEVVAFFLKQTQGNIKYPIAAKIALDGAIEVLLPDRKEWILYGNAAPKLGQIFAKERINVVYGKIKNEKKQASALYYEKGKLNDFVLKVLKNLQHPTLVLIEADKWRNYDVWPQLSNANLLKDWNVLNFAPYDRVYKRNDPQFEKLLAVIRMRSGRETPQYLTDSQREFTQLTGAIDATTGSLVHYFSIGCQLVTSKGQRYSSTRHATMLDGVGAGVAYKYPQVVEFVPFFVREDYQDLEDLKKLCRVPHYLRVSPAWPQGNIVLPYPMHLAHELIKDQLCILGMED